MCLGQEVVWYVCYFSIIRLETHSAGCSLSIFHKKIKNCYDRLRWMGAKWADNKTPQAMLYYSISLLKGLWGEWLPSISPHERDLVSCSILIRESFRGNSHSFISTHQPTQVCIIFRLNKGGLPQQVIHLLSHGAHMDYAGSSPTKIKAKIYLKKGSHAETKCIIYLNTLINHPGLIVYT